MINFLLEKVIRCAQMSADCLRASKLVTLGYISLLTFLKRGALIVTSLLFTCRGLPAFEI